MSATDRARPRRVAVVGAAGRMGATVCRAVAAAPELALVAAVDPRRAGERLCDVADVSSPDLVVLADLDAARAAGAEVFVDFTVAEVAAATLRFCAAHGLDVVCGTTGIDATAFADDFPPDGAAHAVICPNFAISAVLMMRFAEAAAPYFDGVEIIELHHDEKVDAPSGTALETARRIAKRRRDAGAGDFAADPTTSTALPGARGGRADANVAVHSVRLRGLVAHQEVVFGALGQALTIRQDSFDRTSFMPGVLLALAKGASLPGLTVGLDALLDA